MPGNIVPSAFAKKTWGIILSDINNSFLWPSQKKLRVNKSDMILELSQATLGTSCKPGERTVVELQVALDAEKEIAETFTLVSLREGVSEHLPLNLLLRPPVSFNLAAGSGPVTLFGILQDFADSDAFDSVDESGLNDSFIVSEGLPTSSFPSRKRKLDSLVVEYNKIESAEGDDPISEESDCTIVSEIQSLPIDKLVESTDKCLKSNHKSTPQSLHSEKACKKIKLDFDTIIFDDYSDNENW